MLGKNKTETYYTISVRYEATSKKIITILCETDGADNFEFIASFDKLIDPQASSLIKKAKGYSFSTTEVEELINFYSADVKQSVNSILTENNIKLTDIDFICLENLTLDDKFKADIASPIFKEFNIPVIYDLDLTDNSKFLKTLANTKNFESGIIINLDQNFDIYKLNSSAHFISETLGFSVLRYLTMYLNIEADKLAHLIAQGQINEGIINSINKESNLESIQKELINLIIFSTISTEDKLRTAFSLIKYLLLKNLAEFDKTTKIMLIGNTGLLEELNQALKDVFENTEFLKNQSQRQDTLINEHMAFIGAKKYTLENYNNGIKLS